MFFLICFLRYYLFWQILKREKKIGLLHTNFVKPYTQVTIPHNLPHPSQIRKVSKYSGLGIKWAESWTAVSCGRELLVPNIQIKRLWGGHYSLYRNCICIFLCIIFTDHVQQPLKTHIVVGGGVV